jgi:peptide methionine sulfoxide reductase MsrA
LRSRGALSNRRLCRKRRAAQTGKGVKGRDYEIAWQNDWHHYRERAKFYPAEHYHQDYHTKSPLRYKYYRWNCGRNQRVEKLWGDKAYTGIPKKG